ncbi:MAG: hypothetical protein ACRCYQ_11380 [Nocardioides sp.]
MNIHLTAAGHHTVRNAVRAVGLAALAAPMAVALTVGAAPSAHADAKPEQAPVVALDDLDPIVPEIPEDLAVDDDDCEQTDTCGGTEDPDPGEDPAGPAGPDDLTTEDDCEQTDTCGGGTDGGEGGADGGDIEEDQSDDAGDYAKPNRIDAGTTEASDSGVPEGLPWVLSGGVIVSAAGLALAGRRLRGGEAG